MKKEIKFVVANICILVKINAHYSFFYENKRYISFLSNSSQESDCVIDYIFTTPEEIDVILAKCSLIRRQGVAGDYYSYQNGQAFLFDVYYLDNIVGRKLLLFNQDRKSATVYIDTQKINEYYYDDLMVIFSTLLSQDNGLILHCTAVKNKETNEVKIFSGESGNGKSTIAKIFQESNRYTILNDDRIIIRKAGERYLAYGSPWYSKTQLNANEWGEVKDIYFIFHGKSNCKQILSVSEARKMFLKNVFYIPNWDNKHLFMTLAFAKNLCRNFVSYKLFFVPDDRVINYLE